MSLFLRAIRGERVERFPVWLMRQAGRYQPSYQKIRKSRTLLEMFLNPEVAAEVTMLPVRELGVDAAIIFSDILVVLRSLGLSVVFPEEGGPFCEKRVASLADVRALEKRDVRESLAPVFKAIGLVKPELSVPLIGFAGGPFTVASYAIEKKGGELHETRSFLHRDPLGFKELINLITDQTIEYVKFQIKAGADCIQIFDSWANVLSNDLFVSYSIEPMQKIKKAIGNVPLIYFSRGSSLRSQLINGCDVISFDWLKDLTALHKETDAVIQGNFDPALLFARVEQIEAEVEKTLLSLEPKRVVVNLGHGVLPKTPYENVRAFVDMIQQFTSRQ